MEGGGSHTPKAKHVDYICCSQKLTLASAPVTTVHLQSEEKLWARWIFYSFALLGPGECPRKREVHRTDVDKSREAMWPSRGGHVGIEQQCSQHEFLRSPFVTVENDMYEDPSPPVRVPYDCPRPPMFGFSRRQHGGLWGSRAKVFAVQVFPQCNPHRWQRPPMPGKIRDSPARY